MVHASGAAGVSPRGPAGLARSLAHLPHQTAQRGGVQQSHPQKQSYPQKRRRRRRRRRRREGFVSCLSGCSCRVTVCFILFLLSPFWFVAVVPPHHLATFAFLQAGANPHLVNKNGETPLDVAALYGKLKVSPQTANQPIFNPPFLNGYQSTPFEYCADLSAEGTWPLLNGVSPEKVSRILAR